MAGRLVDAYLTRRSEQPPAEGDPEADLDAVDSLLQDSVSRGRAAWPGLPLDDARFVAHLGARVAPASLGGAHVEDLFLACACAHGVPGAVEAFERAHAVDVRAVHAQGRAPRPPLDELEQLVRAKLF